MALIPHDPARLLESLCALPRETDWVEFKENNFSAENTGKYVSSLANSAMIAQRPHAYLVFGVADDTHEIVGTSVDLAGELIGNEAFILWLNKYLEPHISIEPVSFRYDGKQIELLCIDPGYRQPVRFKQIAYIRIGSNQQPLSNYPERERAIWQITAKYAFEDSTVRPHIIVEDIYRDFSIKPMLDLLKFSGATEAQQINYLQESDLLHDNLQGGFEVPALLALASANNLDKFKALEYKGVRLIIYNGRDKLNATGDIDGKKGYLAAFVPLLAHIMGVIPHTEIMLHGIRVNKSAIPEIAVREFLANAMVHQDFTVQGQRALVEIYKDRVCILNPGEPLIATDRFIDTPTKTRNPRFGKLMRDAGLCEQRGSGVDRAIEAIEREHLPPPLIEVIEGATIVTIYMPRRYADMTREERIRACYQHACLRYERGDPMTNASLRYRFGLTPGQYPQVSRLIAEAIEAGRVRAENPTQSNRNARYVPYYA